LVGDPAHDERVVVIQLLKGQRGGLGVEAGPPFGRLDDAVERDEGRFDQFAPCHSPSRTVDLVITGPASAGPVKAGRRIASSASSARLTAIWTCAGHRWLHDGR